MKSKWEFEYDRIKNDPIAFYDDYYKLLNPEPEGTLEARAEKFKADAYATAGAMAESGVGITVILLDKFIEFWTSHTAKGRKLHFEKQETFNMKLRLKTWIDKDKQFRTIKLTQRLGFGRR